MSAPINSYSAKGDREVIPEGLPSLRGAGPQPEGTHSSMVSSIANASQADAEGAQWDDDEDSSAATAGEYSKLAPKDYDPNISGPHPTEQLHDWAAGGMSDGLDNNDYRGAIGSGGHSPAFGPDSPYQGTPWSGGQARQGGIYVAAPIRR
jgi:hypothetical protein